MRGQKPLPEGSKEKLALALKSARTKGQYQLVLCLWLRAALGMNPRQIAVAVGMSPSGVSKIWTRYFREGESMFRKRGKGGRHHEYFSLPAERKFLDRLLLQTLPGQRVMESRFIQEAYERTLGCPVSISAIHRMLKRNHWRTVDSSQIMMPIGWARVPGALKETLDRVATPFFIETRPVNFIAHSFGQSGTLRPAMNQLCACWRTVRGGACRTAGGTRILEAQPSLQGGLRPAAVRMGRAEAHMA